jgi:hypothetical protein
MAKMRTTKISHKLLVAHRLSSTDTSTDVFPEPEIDHKF